MRRTEQAKEHKMATPIKSLIGFSALALSSIAIAAPAAAEPVSRNVEYSDLNLANAEGQKRLEARVKNAVRMICSSNHRVTLTEKQLENKCTAAATQAAMNDVKVAISNYNSNRRVASSSLSVRTNR
jgi:UrcA family protein